MSVVDYVNCKSLDYPKTIAIWRRHTEEYALKASELAECYAKEKKLRRCSKELHGAYRRLENYTIAVDLVNTLYKEAYGKLLEVTFYVKYERGRKSRHRHLEVRVYITVPLHYTCLQVLNELYRYPYLFVTFIEAKNPELSYYVDELIIHGDYGKVGCREIEGDIGCGSWCNGVARAVLDWDEGRKYWKPLMVEVYDYRDYTWTVGELKCA